MLYIKPALPFYFISGTLMMELLPDRCRQLHVLHIARAKTFTLNSINGSFPPKGMHYMYTLIAVRTRNRNVTRALKCMLIKISEPCNCMTDTSILNT